MQQNYPKPPIFFIESYLSPEQQRLEAKTVSNERFLERDYDAAIDRLKQKGVEI